MARERATGRRLFGTLPGGLVDVGGQDALEAASRYRFCAISKISWV